MSPSRRILPSIPGLRSARRAAGAFVAPEFRAAIASMNEMALDHNHQLLLINQRLDRLAQDDADLREHLTELYRMALDHNHRLSQTEDVAKEVASISQHLPTVLNAISSTNGAARLLRREIESVSAVAERLRSDHDGLEADTDAHIVRLDGHVRSELWPLASKVEGLMGLPSTVEWLLGRVEMVRAEALHELRYGVSSGELPDEPQVEIVNHEALEQSGDGLRLNLGCGHVRLEGYVNVDIRALPGVDVVAPVDALPFDRDSLSEIFSAHVLEHFPQAALQRQLLPYWYGLLEPGGTFRSVVPDVAAMMKQVQAGDITFEAFRLVAYGGQEYEGDFHHTAFTPESLTTLLEEAGFTDAELIERGRVNGDCLEFELSARRPD